MSQGGLKKSITWIQGTALTTGAVLGAGIAVELVADGAVFTADGNYHRPDVVKISGRRRNGCVR